MFLVKSYVVYGKIFKRNIIDVIFDDRGGSKPRGGYIVLEHGLLPPKEFFEKKAFYENFKEEYLGYDIYHYTYKRRVRVKDAETLDAEKRAIDDLYIIEEENSAS